MGKVIISGACPLMTAPKAGTPLSTYTEGSIIKINENGSPVEFYVAKHDYEAGLNGAGRTLVVRKDCYDKRAWNSSDKNAYATSTIDGWLNSTYKSLFSVSVHNAISTTKFKYTVGYGNVSVDTLERAIFLLSCTELGGGSQSWFNVEGSALEKADMLKIAYINGSAIGQWTRSPDTNNAESAVYFTSTGNIQASVCTNNSYGVRPCFTLPSTIKIDENGQVIE